MSAVELWAAADPVLTVRSGFRHTDLLAQSLREARWTLTPDGALTVTAASARFAGRHRAEAPGTVLFAVTDESGTTMAGRLTRDPGGALWRAELTYQAGSARTVDVRLSLAPAPRASPSAVAGVPVPATYAITLTGRTGTGAFGPIPAELSVAAMPSAHPRFAVRLVISSPDIMAVGALLWIASEPGLDDTDAGRCAITAAGGELVATCDARPAGTAAITFTTAVDVPPSLRSIPGLGATPLPATTARVHLTFTGDTVTGEVSATGLLASGEAVPYTATVTGRRPPEP